MSNMNDLDPKPREYLTGHKPLVYGVLKMRQYCLGDQFYEWRTDDGKYVIGHSNGRHDTWFLREDGNTIASNIRDDRQPQSGMAKLVKIAEQRLRRQSAGIEISI